MAENKAQTTFNINCLAGVANEGWFDPWLFLAALKAKCTSLGVHFVKGELENFILKKATLPHLVQDEKQFFKKGALDFATVSTRLECFV